MGEIKKLWAHQKEAIERARDRQTFGLFFDTGTGKSSTAINILREQMNSYSRFFRTIIFCPQIVVSNWRDEFEKHSKIERARICLLGSGSAIKREQKFRHWQKEYPTGFIAVCNYEALLMTKLLQAFKAWSPEALIFDESHRLKNPEAKRSKLAYDLANPWDKATKKPLPKPFTYLLSGSPILNSAMDIFMQYKVMDGGRTFGDNFWAFRKTYFVDRNQYMPSHVKFPKWEIKTLSRDGMDAIAQIQQKIKDSSMHVKKSDCLDLPPFLQQTIKVPLSSDQRVHYEEMKNDFITYTKDAACVTTLAITKALRLSQIVSGYLPLNFSADGEVVPGGGSPNGVASLHFKENPRLEALKELLEELTPHHKVLVWAVWQENYKQIGAMLDKMGLKWVEVHGGTSAKQKSENVASFENDADVRVFLGNPGAGGIGINLTSASYSIFYSRTTSLEHSIQAEARNYRPGSEKHEKITRIDLVAEDSIDELIIESLLRKEELSIKILANRIQCQL